MKSELQEFLDAEACYARADSQAARQTLARLGVAEGCLFHDFYCRYEGGFSSEHTSAMLMELCGEGDFTIDGATSICRQIHGFLDRHLVITAYLDDCSVAVYDLINEAVYDVDFEGGSDRLKEEGLAPAWPSFEAFLQYYFLDGIRFES